MKMRHRVVAAAFAGVALAIPAASARAQRRTHADSVFARARRLVLAGNGAAGRVVIDSVIAAAPESSGVYADALYWRATLGTSSADAEDDYRRIVVEYPLSSHAGDALLQLAQLEIAQGDRASAVVHLQRFLLENPTSSDASRAQVLLVNALFAQNDLPRGCTALTAALKQVPATAIEQRNQLQYYTARCRAMDANPSSNPRVAGASAPPTNDATRHDSTARDSTAHDSTAHDSPAHDSTQRASTQHDSPRQDSTRRDSAHKTAYRYALQIAAYSTRSDAEALVKRLASRGLDARVVGAKRPFRVRVGRYATRAAASAALKKLEARKIHAVVTDLTGEQP